LRKRLTKSILVLSILSLMMVPSTFAAIHDDNRIVDALNTGDTAQAISLLNRAIDTEPGFHLNYYALGRIHYERQQYAEALEQFQKAVDAKSKDWQSLLFLGKCQLAVGDIDAAAISMDLGLKKAKKMKSAFENGMGLVYLAREEYQDADRSFRRAIAGSEADEAAVLKDYETKKFESDAAKDAAVEYVKESKTKERAEYQINLGDANYYQGIPSLAIEEYKKALEIDTAGTEVYYHWAEACLEMRDYACAIEKLQIVLQKDSTYAPAWMRAGGIYFKAAMSSRSRDERKQRFIDAIGSYKRYLELSGKTPDSSSVRVYFELALGYSSVGGHEDAVKYFNDVLSIPFEPRDIYFQLGRSYWYLQDWAKCGENLRKHREWIAASEDNAAATKAKDEEISQMLGDTYYYDKDNRNYILAAQNYKKSIEVKPNQKRILGNLALALHNAGERVEALVFYDKRIEMGLDEKSARTLRRAGLCAMAIANEASGDSDDMMEEEEEEGEEVIAASFAPDPNVNYHELGVGYFKQYLEYSPSDTGIVQQIAIAYLYDLSDCENGVTWFGKLLELDPSNCAGMKSLGYAYFGGVCQPKNYTKALTNLKKAYTCLSNSEGGCADADLILYIAQCYHLRAVAKKDGASEDFKAANDWYKKVLACEPGNQEAIKGRDDTSFEF